MKNPAHPGEIILEDVIKPLGLTVTEAAERLAMSRVALSRVLNCHSSISPDLAVRLEKAGAGSARLWLEMQARWDLSQALMRKQPKVGRLAFD